MKFESGFQALQVWNQEAIQNAPFGLKVWLITMALTFLTSVFFLRSYRGARAALITTVLGLLFTKLVAPGFGLIVFSGLVALTHVLLWPVSLYFLFKDFRLTTNSYYRIWTGWTICIIAVSLVFDTRDASKYLLYLLRQ